MVANEGIVSSYHDGGASREAEESVVIATGVLPASLVPEKAVGVYVVVVASLLAVKGVLLAKLVGGTSPAASESVVGSAQVVGSGEIADKNVRWTV